MERPPFRTGEHPERCGEARLAPPGDPAAVLLSLARDASPESLFNHVLRTYAFGSLLAEQRGWKLDEELFLLGAVLHDMDVTSCSHGH